MAIALSASSSKATKMKLRFGEEKKRGRKLQGGDYWMPVNLSLTADQIKQIRFGHRQGWSQKQVHKACRALRWGVSMSQVAKAIRTMQAEDVKRLKLVG